MSSTLRTLPIPDLIPIVIAARLCGMAPATFRHVVVDELLVEMWCPDWSNGRRHVRRASLETFIGRVITPTEFYEACQTRRAAKEYQRRWRQKQKTEADNA